MREPLIVDLFPDELNFGLALFAINSNTLTEMMAAGMVEPQDLQELFRRFDDMSAIYEKVERHSEGMISFAFEPTTEAEQEALKKTDAYLTLCRELEKLESLNPQKGEANSLKQSEGYVVFTTDGS